MIFKQSRHTLHGPWDTSYSIECTYTGKYVCIKIEYYLSTADTPSSEALPQQPESSVSGENGEISIHIDTGKVTHTTGVMSGDQPPEHPAEANLACESYNVSCHFL